MIFRHLLHITILVVWLGTAYLAYRSESMFAILLTCMVFHVLVESNKRLVRDGLL